MPQREQFAETYADVGRRPMGDHWPDLDADPSRHRLPAGCRAGRCARLTGVPLASLHHQEALGHDHAMRYVRPAELAALAERATRDGWATSSSHMPPLRYAAQRLDWQIIELRRGDGGATSLVPTPAHLAQPRSHSAQVGTGHQPLHTDGAHRRQPPRWLLLHSEQPSATPTMLCRLAPPPLITQHSVVLPPAAQGGLFLIDSGSDRFLAPLHTVGGGWRWDPGCMTPCDQRAREAAAFLSELSEEAHKYEWTEPNQVLLIDNRQVLHGRADASNDPDRHLTRLSYSPRNA